jgi:lipopolysaccharide/colanic/teichoic acid biosynthesis glycosyltransferase
MKNYFFKLIFDLLTSSILLLVLSPLLLVLFFLVWIFLGWPVFFSQARPGLHGRIFKLIKFRTMRDLRDTNGSLLPDEQRLTGFGRFLRSTSLDELPELFNVLKGEMSLVGPRPNAGGRENLVSLYTSFAQCIRTGTFCIHCHLIYCKKRKKLIY